MREAVYTQGSGLRWTGLRCMLCSPSLQVMGAFDGSFFQVEVARDPAADAWIGLAAYLWIFGRLAT